MATNFSYKKIVQDLRKRSKIIMSKKDYISNKDFDSKYITTLLKNKRSKFVLCFKEHLIYNDYTQFNKKFYSIEHCIKRLSYLLYLSEEFRVIFPNYLKLTSCKYIYYNLRCKQNIYNKNPQEYNKKDKISDVKIKKEKEEDNEDEEHDSNKFFTKKVYNSINDDESIYKNNVDERIFENFYSNKKKEDSIHSVENFIEMIEKQKFNEKFHFSSLFNQDYKPFNDQSNNQKILNSNLFKHTSIYNYDNIKNEDCNIYDKEEEQECYYNPFIPKKDVSLNMKHKIGFLKKKSINSLKIGLLHDNIFFHELQANVDLHKSPHELNIFKNAKIIPVDKMYRSKKSKFNSDNKNHFLNKSSYSRKSFQIINNYTLRPQTSNIKSLLFPSQELKTERNVTDRTKQKLNSINIQFSSKKSNIHSETYSLNFSALRNITKENNKKNKEKVYTLNKLSKIKSHPKQLTIRKIESIKINSLMDSTIDKAFKSGKDQLGLFNKSQVNLFQNSILSKRIRMNNLFMKNIKSSR